MNVWNEPAPVFGRSQLPYELFELSLKNTEMERICVESTSYARLKGKHIFTMALESNESCCNRNGESKPNGKCPIARYGKTEQREVWIIRCGY